MFLFLWTWCKLYHYFVSQSFGQSNSSNQPVALSGDTVPPKGFSQTRCLAVLIPVNILPRQCVTIKGELLPPNMISQPSTFFHLTSFQKYIVGLKNERNWLTSPLMAGLCLLGYIPCLVEGNEQHLLFVFAIIFFPCLSQVATGFTFTS